jgi:hypothetical protein
MKTSGNEEAGKEKVKIKVRKGCKG